MPMPVHASMNDAIIKSKVSSTTAMIQHVSSVIIVFFTFRSVTGRIKGYVDGRIEMKCSIPHGCNESKSVSLKFNDTFVQRVNISETTTNFVCVNSNGGRYHDVCKDHMSSSYLNGSCSVIFVLEKTPAFLNNTYLRCHTKFDNVHINDSHSLYETVIFLQRNGTTPNTAPNTTTSTNEKTTLKAFVTDSFIVIPDKEVYSNEGSDVTLDWDFHVRSWSSSPAKVSEFLFGVWAPPGFVRNKILAVQEHNVVLKRNGFEKKVNWSGNIYGCVECKSKIQMYNLTSADFKTYGVEVELGLDRNPLTNSLRLVKIVPAKIIKWLRRIEVKEGNATTIECKATGRPSPSVIIKTKNHTLCNNTGHCLYRILAVKPVHEGEYFCLVQQTNSSQIRRSLNLTVLERRKIPTKRDIADNGENDDRTTPNNTRKLKLMALVIAVVGFVIAALFLLFVTVFEKKAKKQNRSNSDCYIDRDSMRIERVPIRPLKNGKEAESVKDEVAGTSYGERSHAQAVQALI